VNRIKQVWDKSTKSEDKMQKSIVFELISVYNLFEDIFVKDGESIW